MDSIPPDAPAPRLCHVIKRADFEGFGFNLFAGKVKTGQFIGKVDANSPAEAAGLKAGDRIVEVNGVNIGNENHKQVVQRIKLRPEETELLVVDDETDEYYATRGIVIKSNQSNVLRKSSAIRKASSSEEEEDTKADSFSSKSSLEDNAPEPRLCHVVKWNEADGFGFHLLADKKRKGQFIGKVDPGSAAEAAGLKLGDRIIEVNGHHVIDETHKEVVQRIKAVPNETRLLVIDPAGQIYYSERNITIHSAMANVQSLKTPSRPQNNRPVTLIVEKSNGKLPLKELSSAPPPRLCHMVKWRQDGGYGFHLLADKKRTGHFIGKVDPDTPAEAAGLKVQDRIIEVNGHCVVDEAHKQIVERIKAVPNETKLLVLDPEADVYYRERDIQVNGMQSNVVYLKTPARTAKHDSSDDDDDNNDRVQIRQANNNGSQPRTAPITPTSTSRPLSMGTVSAAMASGLDLNMSAAQLRARLAARKKFDPKRDTMDLRRKHEIIQTM